MIEVINGDTEKVTLDELYRFRHHVFIEHAGWNLPARGGFERDEFDTLTTVHLVRRQDDGSIAGLVRLLPTTSPYMIEMLWPQLLQPCAPPKSPSVWEVTRFGIKPTMDRLERKTTVSELVLGCIEYGVTHRIVSMLAVMSAGLANRIIRDLGWSYEQCGPSLRIGRNIAIAVSMRPTFHALLSVRERTGISESVCVHREG